MVASQDLTRKRRILFCGEASYLNTGYATYTREVLRRLHSTGKYDIAELGTYGKPDEPEINDIPWKFYPNIPDINNTKAVQEYNSNNINQFGAWKFESICLDFKPDIVCDIRDFWMMEFQERSPFRKFYNWTIMPTVDAAPQHKQWIHTYANADGVFTYSDWALSSLKEQSGAAINCLGSAPPSADSSYSPVQDKEAHKRSLGFEDGVKIIGTVMRNQRRKLYPDLFEAFRLFLDKSRRTDVYLYCHTSYPDLGWDLPEIMMKCGVASKCLFTYICSECGYVFPDFFKDAISQCKKCNKFSAKLSNVRNGVPVEILSSIVNCFDLYVQYANSEGFGLPQVEAAACGVPVMSVDYSAMSSVIRKLGGTPLRPKTLYKELETGCMRAVPDNEYTAQKFVEFFDLPQAIRMKKGFESRKLFEEHYQWDQTADKWEQRFDSVEILPESETWKSPPRIHLPSDRYPEGMDNKNLVDWLIINVLGESEKLNSYMASRLVRDLNYGQSTEGMGGIYYNENSLLDSSPKTIIFNPHDAYKHMLELCNRRNYWEKMRHKVLS